MGHCRIQFSCDFICALKNRQDNGLPATHAYWRSVGRRVYTSDVRHIGYNDTQSINWCSRPRSSSMSERSSHPSKVCEHGARRGHCSLEQVQNRKET
ncbi:hypothetical protein QR685DRAFT_574955 [Neurospora intermedia]|uniref:Questionable protein n=1 Tax=Neurospora intermedia TaxID=5142 RepID=A0ABR3D2G5_NEUIN